MAALYPTSIRRYYPAVAFLMLGAALGAWHNRAAEHGRADLVSGVVQTVVAEPAAMLRRSVSWCGAQAGWMLSGRRLAAENSQLREQVAELESETARLREQAVENDRLRADLNFTRKQGAPLLGADVLAMKTDPKFDTMVIGRGSRDGLHSDSVVVTRLGLVGRVIDTAPATSTVLLLTDQNSGAGGRVDRAASRAVGVCKGDNSRLLSLEYLSSDADIRSGDRVVTSGLGGVFPANIVIGTVRSVREDGDNGQKVASVLPAVNFDRLESVYVLR